MPQTLKNNKLAEERTLERIAEQQLHHNSRVRCGALAREDAQTDPSSSCLPASQRTETHRSTGARVPHPLSHVIIRLNQPFFLAI